MSDDKRTYVQDNRFYIAGDFNTDMESAVVPALRKAIDNQANLKDGMVELWIASDGGLAYVLVQIVELVEYAKRKGVKVRTIVASHASSCGSMLAVSGTKGERYISRYAEHYVHYGQFDGYRKTTPLQVERHADRWRRWTVVIADHYRKYAHIPDLETKLADDDLWVPAGDAILWGMADKYMEELD